MVLWELLFFLSFIIFFFSSIPRAETEHAERESASKLSGRVEIRPLDKWRGGVAWVFEMAARLGGEIAACGRGGARGQVARR